MNISQSCNLFLTDLYFYDISSCYYQIAQSVFYNLEGIDKNDKTARNIALGKEQINNEAFSSFLLSSAESIVSYYLEENRVGDDEIVLVQKDGCILTRLLKENEFFIKMDFREHINFMIISLDRKKFLYVSEQEVTVKGMPNRYPGIDQIYDKFKNLNLYNKKGLFKQLQKIKDLVVNGEDFSTYKIVKGEKNLVITKSYGIMEVEEGVKFKIKDIDREKYYDLYIREFMEPLQLHFHG